MPSGYRSGGVDFDELFDPDVMGNGPTAPGYRANGQALRYAHIQYGSKGPDVGRREGGVDISNKWARKGSAVYALGFNGKGYSATSSAPTDGTQNPTARLSLTINSNGTWQISRTVLGSIGGNGGVTLETGSWLPSGHSAGDYQVQFSGSASGGGSVNNGAATPQSCATSRTFSLEASVAAASADLIDTSISLQCTMTRVSAGTTTNSTCSFNCRALGYA